jgi:hypothetical protein
MIHVASDVKVCSHCQIDYKVRLSSDIGVRLHWVGKFLYFEVVLLVFTFIPECNTTCVLYREVYR